MQAAETDYVTRLRPTYGTATLLVAVGLSVPPLLAFVAGNFGSRIDLVNVGAAAVCVALRLWHLLPGKRHAVGLPLVSAIITLAAINVAFINATHPTLTPRTLALLPLVFICVTLLFPNRIWLAATVGVQLTSLGIAFKIQGWSLATHHSEIGGFAIGLLATAIVLGYKRREQKRMLYLTATDREFRARLQEEALQRFALQQRNSVNQRLASLARFSSGLLNDFNNVLMPISGNAAMLAATDLTHQQQHQVDAIQQATRRAAGLAQHVGALTGPRSLKAERYDFALATEELVTVIRRAVAEDARIVFRGDAADASPVRREVHAPKGAAQHLLARLLMHIVALHDHEAAVQLRLSIDTRQARRVRLIIRDTTRAQRGERSIELQPFLVNLSETQQALADIGGELTFTSDAEGDDLFVFSLPRPQASAADTTAAPARPVARAQARELLALVVDDEPAVREVTATLLRGVGFDVVEASDGDAAIARCDQTCPDLIVMDVLMPGLPAREALERIRATHGLIPVLVCTGPSMQPLDWVESMADATLLLKPFAAEELIDAALGLVGPQPN